MSKNVGNQWIPLEDDALDAVAGGYVPAASPAVGSPVVGVGVDDYGPYTDYADMGGYPVAYGGPVMGGPVVGVGVDDYGPYTDYTDMGGPVVGVGVDDYGPYTDYA